MKLSMKTILEGKTVAEYEEMFGAVDYEGDTYITLQQAYISGLGEDAEYVTSAVKLGEEIDEDDEGNPFRVNVYEVSWIPVEGWENNDDESDNCDWDSPDGCREVSWAYVG